MGDMHSSYLYSAIKGMIERQFIHPAALLKRFRLASMGIPALPDILASYNALSVLAGNTQVCQQLPTISMSLAGLAAIGQVASLSAFSLASGFETH